MTDDSSERREPRVSGNKSRWTEWGVLGTVCLLVIGVYAYAAQSGVLDLVSLNAADTYYNLLVQGFRAGRLSLKKDVPPGLAQLADPYDPAANALYRSERYRMHDLSYYKGRLYLYFGATPALILFWPFAALTGHYLFHRQAVAIFCALGFLASVGLLRALWRQYFAGVSLGVVAACVLALGLATGVPVLLSRSDVYEVAISCAYLLVMLALGAIWRSLHEPPRHRMSGSGWFTTPGAWLAAASLTYGLALGARPGLLFGAVILLVPAAQAWCKRRPFLALLAAAVGPITVIGLGLMLYNVLRFENPFEFGLRFQLASGRQDTLQLFSLRYLWWNFRVYFLEPARWSSPFPFVHVIGGPPLPSGYGQVEVRCGVLTNIPVVWLALAAPLAWRGRPAKERSVLYGLLAAVVLAFGIDASTICLFRGGNVRYEVDFLPALVLLAVVGILGLERALAPKTCGACPEGFRGWPAWRRVVRGAWGVALGYSVAFNLLASVENCAVTHCYMGMALYEVGKIQEAMRYYQQALRIKPDLAEAHSNLGVALEQTGRIREAIGHYQLALRIKPYDAEAYNNLATSLVELGKLPEAVGFYEQALRIKPNYAKAHDNLGNALVRSGRTEDAIRHYQEALRIKPDFAEAHTDLGGAMLTLGRVPEALEHFELAVRLRPDSAEAHYNLGIALEQAGRIQEAIGHHQHALRIKPDFAEAQNSLARLRAVQ